MKKLMLIIFVLIPFFIFPQNRSYKQKSGRKMNYLGTTIHLKDMVPVVTTDVYPGKPKRNDYSAYQEKSKKNQIDKLIQSEMISDDSITLLQNFDGVPSLNVSNPDTQGDVGSNHYFQMVKRSFSIWNKEGDLLYGPAENRTIWSGYSGGWDNCEWTDPIVIYDHLSDRWLASCMVYNIPEGEYYEMIAVSATNDPLGSWHCYSLFFDVMPDYPKFGLWADGYYLSINEYEITPSYQSTFVGASIIVFNREELMNGNPEPIIIYFHLDAPNQHISEDIACFLPSNLDGSPPPEGTPNYYVCVRDDFFGFPHDCFWIWECDIDWVDTSNCHFSEVAVLDVEDFNSNLENMAFIHQPNTTQTLHSHSHFLMYKLQYRDFGEYQTLLCNHTVEVDGNDHGGVRWYEARNYGDGWFIHQQSTYAPDDESRWMGSIAMDADGNIGLGYSVSSDIVYPSVKVTGRRYYDENGLMTFQEKSIIDGSGSQINNSRWGDYSTMSIDPNDDLTFWYTQEYMPASGPFEWKTRISSFQLHKNLSLSADSLLFITLDDCFNGKQITLKNNSMYDVEIIDIKPVGDISIAQWQIDPYNFTFPFTLDKGDSIVLPVFIQFLSNQTNKGFFIDTLKVMTDYRNYNFPIYLDDQLQTGMNSLESNSNTFLSVFPNPSNLEVKIKVLLEKESVTDINIWNNNMQNVYSIVKNKKLEKGEHIFEWNGNDHSGNILSKGIYYIQLKTDNEEHIRKIIRY